MCVEEVVAQDLQVGVDLSHLAGHVDEVANEVVGRDFARVCRRCALSGVSPIVLTPGPSVLAAHPGPGRSSPSMTNPLWRLSEMPATSG